MDPMTYAVLFIFATVISAYLVAFAYKNTKFTLKHKIAQKREVAISREVRMFLYIDGPEGCPKNMQPFHLDVNRLKDIKRVHVITSN